MIIGLSGRIESGKDTLAGLMIKHYPKFRNKKFAYKLKQVASIMTGYSVELFETQDFKSKILMDWGITAREFLQKLGTDAIRNNLDKDAWVKALLANYVDDEWWVITDCRFENEANAIRNNGGYLIRLRRNEDVEAVHDSETALDNYNFDYTIDNRDMGVDETWLSLNEIIRGILIREITSHNE